MYMPIVFDGCRWIALRGRLWWSHRESPSIISQITWVFTTLYMLITTYQYSPHFYWVLNSLCLSCRNSLIASLIAGSINNNFTSSFLTEWYNPSYRFASSIVSSKRSFDWNSNMIPWHQLEKRDGVKRGTYIHRSWACSVLYPISGVDLLLLDEGVGAGIDTFVDVRDLIDNLWSIPSVWFTPWGNWSDLICWDSFLHSCFHMLSI